MPILKIKPRDWERAKKLVTEELTFPENYTGIININKKDFSPKLGHSFVAYVENGELKHLLAKSRQKIVEEGVLGAGAFGVCVIGQAEDGSQFAVKIQGKEGKHAVNKDLIASEMALLERTEELKGQGYSGRKHISIIKLKQGRELFKQIYVPVFDEQGKITKYEKKRNFTKKEQYLLAIKCLQGIKFLHDKNIVHRDIKPENILARFGEGDKKDIIIISPIDLGLAHVLEKGETIRSNVMPAGTPGYMAPEVYHQILRKENDIYSLGVLFRDDLGLSANDVFLKRMLDPDPENRPSIDECIEYYKNLLELELNAEVKGEERAGRRPPGLYMSSMTESRMDALLAEEAVLLEQLKTELGPKDQNVKRLNDRIHDLKDHIKKRTPQKIQVFLAKGYSLISDILKNPQLKSNISSGLRQKLTNFQSKLEEIFKKVQTASAPTPASERPPTKPPRRKPRA